MQEGQASLRPSQAEAANKYEAIQLETLDVVSEQGVSANIHHDSPMVPESPNAAFNSPSLLGADDETIDYMALVDSAQNRILNLTSHNDSVGKGECRNSKAQEDGDLTDDETDAIGTFHVYTPNPSADRDWVKPKSNFKKRATGLNHEAQTRLKRNSRPTVQLNTTYRVLNSRKRWLQCLRELEGRVRDLSQRLDEIYKERVRSRER